MLTVFPKKQAFTCEVKVGGERDYLCISSRWNCIMKLLLCNIQRRYQLCVRRNENALVLHRVLRLSGWHDGLIAVWLTIHEHVCVWRLLRLFSQLGNPNISWLPVWPLICIISVGEHAESRSFCTICFLAEWLVSFIVMYACLNTHVSLFVPFFYTHSHADEPMISASCSTVANCLFKIVEKWVAHCSKLWKNETRTVPKFDKMSRALFKIVGNISCPLFIMISKLWKNESHTFHKLNFEKMSHALYKICKMSCSLFKFLEKK